MEPQARPYTPAEILRPRPVALRRQRALFSAGVLLPALGAVCAIALWPWRPPTALDLVLLLGLYVVAGVGVEVGFHRLFAHRSFRATQRLRLALAVAGSSALQGPLSYWVSHHRRHHQLADRAGDPHSPSHERSGLRGLLHAHLGWFFSAERTNAAHYARDLLGDRQLMRVERLYPVWVALGLLLPAAIGGAWTLSLSGALGGLLWGGLVRIFVGQQLTFAVNSLGHTFGSRPTPTWDRSTNLGWLALPTFGGSLHNNHHAYPGRATTRMRGLELDPGAWVIRLFVTLKLARDARLETRLAPEEVEWR